MGGVTDVAQSEESGEGNLLPFRCRSNIAVRCLRVGRGAVGLAWRREHRGLAMCGTMHTHVDVQSTSKRTEMWALSIALIHWEGPAVIHTDTFGVVRAFKNGEVNCICAKHQRCGLVGFDMTAAARHKKKQGWHAKVKWV